METPDSEITVRLTSRQLRLLEVALWRFIHTAYARADAAAQQRIGITDKAGIQASEAFLHDARDAETLAQTLRSRLTEVSAIDDER